MQLFWQEHAEPLDSLFRRAQDGDSAASDQLFRTLRNKLRLVAAARLRGWRTEEQEDIVQDALCVVAEKLDEIEDGVQRYALQVLRYKIGSAYQAAKARHNHTTSPEFGSEWAKGDAETERAPSHSPLSEYDHAIERERRVELILSTLRHLPEYCRLVLTGLLEGFSIAELWSKVQAIEPSLKRTAFDKRIFDCKAKVRILLAGQME